MQSSTNWAIKPSKSWSFCEFVIFFSRRFATWLRRSILSPPTRKKPLAPRVVDNDQFKWIFERPYTQLGFESPVQAWIFFFFTTTLVVCRGTIINHIYSFIFIPLSFLFLSFYHSIFQVTFLSFLFFNTAYFIYRSLAPALFSERHNRHWLAQPVNAVFLIRFRRLNPYYSFGRHPWNKGIMLKFMLLGWRFIWSNYAGLKWHQPTSMVLQLKQTFLVV